MRAMKRITFKRLSGLWKGRAGGVLVYVAIAAPVLIGLAGASVDIGLWYASKRLAQSAADSAAMAAALESVRSDGGFRRHGGGLGVRALRRRHR